MPDLSGGSSSGTGGGSLLPMLLSLFGGNRGGKQGCGSRLLVIIVVIIAILLCLFVVLPMFSGGNSGLTDLLGDGELAPIDNGGVLPPSAPTQRPPETAFTPPARASSDQTWLVMLYQDADDKVLEQDIYIDLNEAERTGSTDRVNIVAQVDRFRGGYSGDGNWDNTYRFYIQQDDDLNRVTSPVAADLGEVNMSDGQTLVDFVTWAVQNFEADRYVLILSDHGLGWPGGWSDPTGSGNDPGGIPMTSQLGNNLYLNELDAALSEIRSQTGVDRFDMIGMDACLMGDLAVYEMLSEHADYAVASQEVEPALGWAYTGFLNALTSNPDMTTEDLTKLIVQSYINEDERIQDDQARAGFAGQGNPLGGLFGGGYSAPTADQLIDQLGKGITLSAVDLKEMPTLLNAFNEFAYNLQGANPQSVAQARSYAQSYTSIFGNQVPPSYIDLAHFTQLLVQTGAVSSGDAQALLSAIDQAVVAEKHGSKKPGSNGISVYFPNSQLYGNPVAGPRSYTAIAGSFAEASLWDDFLGFHYTGQQFGPADQLPVAPDEGLVQSPASGGITISPLELSADSVAPGESITLAANIDGANIGYVYLFVGYLDQAANSINVVDTDYIESPNTRELDGVYYPDWGSESFRLTFDWEPLAFAIDDGQDTMTALFNPESYGQSFEEAVYTVEGVYTYADEGDSLDARLYFVNGVLTQVVTFSLGDASGAPRAIVPSAGDTFTVREKWLDLASDGSVAGESLEESGTLTFGDRMFTWVDQYAAAGNYIVGFIVEDLDGRQYPVYAPVVVE